MDRKKQNIKRPTPNRKVQNQNITSIEKRRMEQMKNYNNSNYPKVPTYNRTYNQYSTQSRYNNQLNRNNVYSRNYYNQYNIKIKIFL